MLLVLAACTTAARREPEPAPDFGPPGVASVEPPVPPFERGMMDHADRFGFVADPVEFGYCMTDGGAGATRCGFLDASGRLRTLSDFAPGTEEPDAQVTAALGRRIARVVPPGPWRFARDLVLVWQVTGARDPSEPAPGVRPPPVLRVGARVRTATAATLPIVIEARPEAYTIHPEAIVVSPEGTTLAVLSHDFGGEFSDRFEVRSIPAAALARDAYTAAAGERERAGAWAEAQRLYRLAAQCSAAR
jgi:hypothetical protein